MKFYYSIVIAKAQNIMFWRLNQHHECDEIKLSEICSWQDKQWTHSSLPTIIYNIIIKLKVDTVYCFK